MLKKKLRLDDTIEKYKARLVAKGLAYVHGAGLVHEDVKPRNVMISWIFISRRFARSGVAKTRPSGTRPPK